MRNYSFYCMKSVPVNRTVLGVPVKFKNHIHTSLLGGLASKSTRNVINCYSRPPHPPKKYSNVIIYIDQHMNIIVWNYVINKHKILRYISVINRHSHVEDNTKEYIKLTCEMLKHIRTIINTAVWILRSVRCWNTPSYSSPLRYI